MDYSKSGGATSGGKREPRHIDQTGKGKANPPGGRASKEELVARMKAAAEAKKK